MGKEKGCRKFGGKAEGKRQVGEPKCRWESNIKMKL
jgi:hypothetical protein